MRANKRNEPNKSAGKQDKGGAYERFGLSPEQVPQGVTEVELQDLKETFDFLDIDNSGTISAHELLKAFETLGLTNDKRLVNVITSASDDDGSGQLDFAEFVKISTSKTSDVFTEDDARRALSYFDPDRSGQISWLELKGVGHEIGETMNDEQYKRMFKKADRDGNGFISQDEVLAILNNDDRFYGSHNFA